MPRHRPRRPSNTTRLAAALLLGLGSESPPWPSAGATETPVAGVEEGRMFHFPGTDTPPWQATRLVNRLSGLSASLGPMPFPGGDSDLSLHGVTGSRRILGTDRVVLRHVPDDARPLAEAIRSGLRPDRSLGPGWKIFQATDPWSAAEIADRLGHLPGVSLASPVYRRTAALQGPFGPRPDDPYFAQQWHLENRDSVGQPLGPDTNPRGAWKVTRGEGVTVAICDNGFETSHPDLSEPATGQAHFDFTRNRAVAAVYGAHATCVAGLAGAMGSNRVGITGLAPGAALLSAAIFDGSGGIASDERLFDAYRYRNETVAVQNHSWANSDLTLASPGPLERAGMSNAVTDGRAGKGVIVVRAAGNYREDRYNANYDGAANDPGAITVAAVRQDGRVASYSNPGACILVAAPSGDDNAPFLPTPNLFTTDQVGSRGYNAGGAGDLPNYAFGPSGFWGTSAATPQIAGIAALILSANPALTRRDVQQVFLHAARHHDLTDPAVHRNGAGYRVSENQGFGIPDAGQAVSLARAWSNRPPISTLRFPTNLLLQIPNDGLRVLVQGADGVARSIACAPAPGPHPDDPTPDLPLVFVGRATAPLTNSLAGKAALIERGDSFFRDKVRFAADAGAAFVVLYNHINGEEIFAPEGTDFVPIPAVLISENEGRALVRRLQSGENVSARLRLDSVQHRFVVQQTLVCEHVGLRVRASHDRRGDLRITLTSPAGTRSVLQSLNDDTEPGPDNWTYWSVHHFYEASAGTWTVSVSDEAASVRGALTELELILLGTPITDTDADGLDDDWERAAFGSLAAGPAEDPDADGSPNAREQVLQRDPTRADEPLRLDLASYDQRQLLRLSWPGTEGTTYGLFRGSSAGVGGVEVARVPGAYPETERIVPFDVSTNHFYWIGPLAP